MSQITRLPNGSTVQVRTGAIQGIGPQGPTGATGPQGPPGVGIQGPRGETGSVDESVTYAKNDVSVQSIAATTNTLVDVGSTIKDDFTARQSTSAFAFPVGTYIFHAKVGFGKSSGTPTGYRVVRLLVNGAEEWAITVPATTAQVTDVPLSGGFVITNPAHTVSIQAYHTDSVSLYVASSRLWVSRIGAGLKGDPGERGETGPVGATGATGPQGPAGTIGNNLTTFADLGGDDA